MNKVIGILLLFCLAGFLSATTYYVDKTTGNDSDTGLTEELAWETINKVNISSFNPDDIIKFKKGEVWRETLAVPSSGISGHRITFTSYGSGDDPLILGSDLMTNWVAHDTNIWKKTGVTTVPGCVVYDGAWGEYESGGIGSLDTEKEWYWASDVVYVYTTGGDPDTQWPSGIDVAQRERGVYFWDGSNVHNYITIDGFDMRHMCSHGVDLVGSPGGTNSTVTNCNMYGIRRHGINGGAQSNNNTYSYNTMSYLSQGININSGGGAAATGNIIEYNEVSETRAMRGYGGGGAVLLYNADGTIVRYNYFHDARDNGAGRDGDGIMIGDCYGDVDTDDCEIYYNIVTRFNDGLDIGGDGNEIYNNIVIDCYAVSYHIGDTAAADNNIVKNNIFYDTNATTLLNHADDCGTNNTIDYNCYYDPDNPDPDSGDVINWQITNNGENWGTMTWNEWVAHGKYDQNSIYADPLFVDEGSNDFHIPTGSPCKDVGTDIGLTVDYFSNLVPSGVVPDIGSHEYQQGDTGILRIRDVLRIRNLLRIK